jgi:hypothetical protein
MKIKLDLDRWRKVAKTERCWTTPEGSEPQFVKFVLPERTDIVVARIVDEGTKIEIFPDRSSSHRALMDALEA